MEEAFYVLPFVSMCLCGSIDCKSAVTTQEDIEHWALKIEHWTFALNHYIKTRRLTKEVAFYVLPFVTMCLCGSIDCKSAVNTQVDIEHWALKIEHWTFVFCQEDTKTRRTAKTLFFMYLFPFLCQFIILLFGPSNKDIRYKSATQRLLNPSCSARPIKKTKVKIKKSKIKNRWF